MGHVLTSMLSVAGHEISLITSKPEKWEKEIVATDMRGNEFVGIINEISSNVSTIIPNSDVVILCLPGFMLKGAIENIKPYLSKSTIVGSVVASTGFFDFAHDIFEKNQPLFAFQRVPYIAMTNVYGKSVKLAGYKTMLNVAIEGFTKLDASEFQKFLSESLNTPVTLLDSYLEASLTNSNPLIHSSRLYCLWKDWHGEFFDRQIYFYREWNVFSSEILIACDSEFMEVVNKLDLKNKIPCLLDYYESIDAVSLTNKLQSIEAFLDVKAPMLKCEKGYYPDINHRYFKEDVDFGIRLVKKLAVQYKVETPTIDKIIEWADSLNN